MQLQNTHLSLLALVITAIGAIVLIARYLDVKREEEEEAEPVVSPESRLAEFERAFYAGQMTKEEFLRIKETLFQDKPAPKAKPSGKVFPLDKEADTAIKHDDPDVGPRDRFQS